MKIILNVGGEKFETTDTTLTKCVWFKRFLENPSEDNFIDRSSKHFGRILEILRTSESSKKNANFVDEDDYVDFVNELNYYGLDVPEDYEENWLDKERVRKRKRLEKLYGKWDTINYYDQSWYKQMIDHILEFSDERPAELRFGSFWWQTRTNRCITGSHGYHSTNASDMLSETRYPNEIFDLEENLTMDTPECISHVEVIRRAKIVILRFIYCD